MGSKQINPLFGIQEETRKMIIGNPYRFGESPLIFTLSKYGTGSGVATLTMRTTINQTITILDGSAKFYTDSGGTTGESTTWNITSGANRIIYLRCSSTTSNVSCTGSLITYIRWQSVSNSPSLNADISKFINLTEFYLGGYSSITGSFPNTLLKFTSDTFRSVWTYNGSLPSGMTYFSCYGDGISWSYNGSLPSGLTYLKMEGNNLNWTGLNVGNNGNITNFELKKYRTSKMSSADMVTLLTQLTNRTGTLPKTITINDYADYASPPSSVTDAVTALKAAKSITTVNLGA